MITNIFTMGDPGSRVLFQVSSLFQAIPTTTNIFQGSDPSTYALIEKLQGLNQRYLRVCGELGEKQALLHLQEKMYMEMKNAITKQPGPEVSEQLSVYQSVLKEKAKQLKVGGTRTLVP